MHTFGEWIATIAHTITSILGLLALWGLWKHRAKIAAFVRFFAYSAVNERIKKIKGTLGQLESLNYDDKRNRQQIISILGSLSGMVRILADRHSNFKAFHAEITEYTVHPEKLSEPTKRRLTEELHGLLDEQAFSAATSIIEITNGPKNTGHH